MIPFKTNPKREELVKLAGMWNPRMVKGGAEALELMKNLEGEGATRREIYDETGKLLDPKVDAGMFRGADDLPRVHSSDEMMKIKKETGQYFNSILGGTTDIRPFGEFVEHPLMAERAPATMDTPTVLTMPEEARSGEKARSGGGWYKHSTEFDKSKGGAQLFARSRSDERDINSDKYMGLKDVVAHEGAGHLLQDVGGYTRGASSTDPVMASEFERLVHPRVKLYAQALGDLKDQQGGFLDPEQQMYYDEAKRLFVPARGNPKGSALNYLDRYENVYGESGARRDAEYSNLSAEALRALPDETMPWATAKGAHAPEVFQMLHYPRVAGSGKSTWEMPDEKGTLARLLNKKMVR